MTRHPEHQYLDLLRELLEAPARQTRNDTATRSLFGRQMRFDLAHGFPLLTTKRLPFRIIAGELLWFLSGSTNVKPLQEQGITIWDEWADENGELGPVYGKQWRLWESKTWGMPVTIDGVVEGHHPMPRYWPRKGESYPVHSETDQIADVLDSLRRDPYGRRHIVTAWNPGEIPEMALPPCHVLFQFYVGADERLSLQLYQRSADAFLGLPFNIASYALLLEMTAAVLGRRPGEFVWTGGDVHLYSNHEDQARLQIQRDPRPFPTLNLETAHTDLDHWSLDDFAVDGYDPWPHIAAEVSA